VHPSPADANGFKGDQGFPNSGGVTWFPTRVTYPTVTSPLGTQPLLQIAYPGQTESITAEGQTTTAYRYAGSEYTNAAIRTTGTWTGTLSFETSTDGVTWTAKTCFNRGTLVNETSTTVNSTKGWEANTGTNPTTLSDYNYLRVRASAPMTGTANVSVGMQGGQSPARGNFGSLTGTPTRLYMRVGFRTSANFNDNGNVGTKMIFFSKKAQSGQTTNNYFNTTSGSPAEKVSTGINLQPTGWGFSEFIPPSQNFNHGEWHDLELIFHAGTAGNADGIAQVWVDGIQVINDNAVPFFGSLMTPGFTSFYLDPTFGGGSNPPPANQTLQIAQWYYESAP
jgi:hypothetical protein